MSGNYLGTLTMFCGAQKGLDPMGTTGLDHNYTEMTKYVMFISSDFLNQ